MSEYSYKFRGDNVYPIVEVVLEKDKRKIKVDALIDSGATISVFQGSIGEYLGVQIESGQRRIFQGVSGKIVGYIHEVNLQIDNVKFLCKIAFSSELATTLNILGRDNFFEKFLIIFDELNKRLKLDVRV